MRRRAFDGAEWIKIAISGGIADTHGDIAASHMTKEEVAAVTDMAHRHSVKVTAHSGSPGATLEAIEAGLDCVEHGYFLTDEVLGRMVDKGVWLVPTIVVAQRDRDGVLQEDRLARLVSGAGDVGRRVALQRCCRTPSSGT